MPPYSVLSLLLSRLEEPYKSFEEIFTAYIGNRRGRDEDDNEEMYEKANAAITRVLTEICDVVREGASNSALDADDLRDLLLKASELEHSVIDRTYRDVGEHLHDPIPVYCGNNVKDASMGSRLAMGPNAAKDLISIMISWNIQKGSGESVDEERNNMDDVVEQVTGTSLRPYHSMRGPSLHSTPLARFSANRPILPDTASPALRAFAEARCEIAKEDMPIPTRLCMTDSILAVLGAGGWRGHDPMLHLFRLDTETPRNPTRFIANAFEVKVGLSDSARAMDVDAEDSVLYVGDEDRIKSYRWTMGAGDDDDGSALPVRTLDSLGFGGPLVVRDGGVRVLRAGNKGLAIWNTEELPTHGPDGHNRIGQRLSFDIFDTKRDKDGAGIERSIGSEPTQRVETTDFKNAKLWTQHPNDPNQMLVSFEEQYRLSAVDLATQKTAARYLGHGGYIGDIRTNAEDPHVFVTACYDGAVRLYDERLPTPVLTVFHASEWIMTALYEHIGGHPFLIIGGSNTQQVKVWDVRAKAALYELSTGNNDVDVLAWDARRQTLYAATQCQYVDSNGSVGYRRGKFPNTGRPWSEQDGGEDLGDDEDDEDWEDEEENASGYRACNWPDRAFHLEESFGHPLDSATHRLYRYRFKSDANPEVVPKSGYSRVGRSSY